MAVADLMLMGTELLLLGMGIVFGFLTLLVFTLHGMSHFAARLEHRLPQAGLQAGTVKERTDTDELVAVISAAVARYRADRRR